MEFMRLEKFRSAGRLSVLPGAAKFSTQREGARSFVASWQELLKRVADKSKALTGADRKYA
jgi:hypothetical protein